MNLKKKKNGRPSKFDKIDNNILEVLVKKGCTDKEMSKAFGITEQTFNNYKKKYPKFFESLKDWKLEADAKVERSLYERATGYEHVDTYFSNYQGRVSATEYVKHYPPDPTSMIFWLKNRQPERWREKIEVSNLSETELESLRQLAVSEMKENL